MRFCVEQILFFGFSRHITFSQPPKVEHHKICYSIFDNAYRRLFSGEFECLLLKTSHCAKVQFKRVLFPGVLMENEKKNNDTESI